MQKLFFAILKSVVVSVLNALTAASPLLPLAAM